MRKGSSLGGMNIHFSSSTEQFVVSKAKAVGINNNTFDLSLFLSKLVLNQSVDVTEKLYVRHSRHASVFD